MKKSILALIVVLMLSLCWLLPAYAADPILVENISLGQETAVLSVGKTLTLKPVIEPKKATNKKLEWSSSNDEIATVKDGKVKGISTGDVTITVNSSDGSNITATLTISVVQPVKKITTSDSKLILAPGTTWKPEITIEPTDASITKLAWTSSNDRIANVDENGEISAVAVGKCNIIGTATDDSKKKVSISVQVMEHDILILVPGEVQVNFDTRDTAYGSMMQIGRLVIKDTEETTVTFKKGLVCEGTANQTLRPLKPGSETIESVTKHNGKKVTGKSKHTVFIAQSAVPIENDDTIGRLEAESYEGHTYQVFYSNRSWDDAESFCEKHGGHLVTITGEKEQKFIERYLAKAEKQESYWIGLNSGKSSRFSTWVTKEAISYTNWADGNPDRNQSYSCARIAASEYSDKNRWTMKRGSWDDESNTYYYINGFICEWDEDNSPNVLPVNKTIEAEASPKSDTFQNAFPTIITTNTESPFSQSLTLNAGKESETSIIGYFLPSGTYNITNQDTEKAIKIIPYENVKQTIDGSEEFKTPKDKKPILVFPGKTGELSIEENEFILFSDEEFNVLIDKV